MIFILSDEIDILTLNRSVQEAKPLIRQQLIQENLGFAYCEPEGLVMSRSGDECVVTLAAQWYMDYGEESWKVKAKEYFYSFIVS